MAAETIKTKKLVKELRENSYQLQKNTERISHIAILALAFYTAVTTKSKLSKVSLAIAALLIITDEIESILHMSRKRK